MKEKVLYEYKIALVRSESVHFSRCIQCCSRFLPSYATRMQHTEKGSSPKSPTEKYKSHTSFKIKIGPRTSSPVPITFSLSVKKGIPQQLTGLLNISATMSVEFLAKIPRLLLQKMQPEDDNKIQNGLTAAASCFTFVTGR